VSIRVPPDPKPNLQSPSDAHAGHVLAAAWAAQAATAFVIFGLSAIGSQLRSWFAITLVEYGAVFSAVAFGTAIGLFVTGALVDRYGDRLPSLIGLSFAVGGLVMSAAIHGFVGLLLGLWLFGLGSSVVAIAGVTAVFRAYEARELGRAVSFRQTSVTLGGLVGILGCPLIATIAGVRGVLVVGAVLVGVTVVLFVCVVSTAGIPRAARSRSSRRSRLPFGHLFYAPGMQRLLVVGSLYAIVQQSLVIYTVPAARAAGVSILFARVLFGAVLLAASFGRISFGAVAGRSRRGSRAQAIMFPGCVAACGAILFMLALRAGPWVALPAVTLFAFGGMGWNGIAVLAAGEVGSPALVGRYVGALSTVLAISGAASSPLLGLLAERIGWDALWMIVASVAAIGAVAAYGLGRDSPLRST
jgi:predicted MFS family arabinose efflux permease